MDVRVVVISFNIAVTWGGRVPGGSGSAITVAAAGCAGAVTRGATGVFSLFVSCEDVVLGGSVGEDGSGARKFSVSSVSEVAG